MRSVKLISVTCLLVFLMTVAEGNVIENSAQTGIFEKSGLPQQVVRKDASEIIEQEDKASQQVLTDSKSSSDLTATSEKHKSEIEKSDVTEEKTSKPLRAEIDPEQKKNEIRKTENSGDKKKLEVKAEVETTSTSENKGTQPSVERTEMEKTDIPKLEMESKSNSSVEQKVFYNGVKVLRVIIENKEQKKMIKQMEKKGEISTWLGNGTAVDILIKQEKVLKILKDKNLAFDVIIDDLQKAIEEENPPVSQQEMSELEGRKGHKMTWQMYHRMDDIHGYIDYLTATYPDTCSQETIGHSVEGRPLKVLKISSGKSNKTAIWVDSGIHAREWITPATSTYVISQMVEAGDGMHGVDWYFLPIVNPDGYEHSHTVDRLWRKNRANSHKGQCAGIDLNRNFGYRWGGQGASQQPCRETYAGPSAFSEPETSAINKFVLNHSSDLKAYISLHSYGQYILYPWGYDRKVPPDYSDLHRVGRAMAQAMRHSGGQFYRVGSAAATLYPASGGSDDWAKGIAKIKYVYTIELRDTGRHGFVLPAQYIHPTAKETYAALKVLAKEVTLL